MAFTATYRCVRALPAVTIFLGSFLAFFVQPMVARTLLPSFGGSAAVWLSCLAAFQVLLLAGYWYAHRVAGASFLVSRFWFHLAGLLAVAGWMGIVAVFGGRIAGAVSGMCAIPALGVLLAVLVLVGVAYVLLSANASLVQMLAGGDYRLYAVSNLGSFMGLFAYPLVLEPYMAVGAQWWLMAGGVVVYAGMLWRCVCGRDFISRRGAESAEGLDGNGATRPTGNSQLSTLNSQLHPLLWLLLPGMGCFLLNAVTAHLTVNIAPLPLVWAILLGIYLLTWTVGFSSWGERMKPVWIALAALAMVAVMLLHRPNETTGVSLAREFAAGVAVLFFGCCALHAHLCSIRPSGAELTRYNLLLSVGGAIGGTLSGIGAPLVFDSILEWPMALLALAVWFGWYATRLERVRDRAATVIWMVVGVFAMMVWSMVRADRAGDIARGRSFYGPWRVYDRELPTSDGRHRYQVRYFRHGGTAHGFEPVKEVERGIATGYFAPENGGLTFLQHAGYAAGKPVRAAIVGLGVGTMAWYGRKGDVFRFYEICPQVVEMATCGKWFDFVKNSRAKVEIKVGDARRSLEAEREAGEAKWDILAVDAYSGDSIPIHLMTQEAFRLYRDRLAPGGMLALHISNWHTDLVPLAKAAAKHLGMECKVVCARGGLFSMEATWALLTETPVKLPPETQVIRLEEVRDAEVPTDARGSLLKFVRF